MSTEGSFFSTFSFVGVALCGKLREIVGANGSDEIEKSQIGESRAGDGEIMCDFTLKICSEWNIQFDLAEMKSVKKNLVRQFTHLKV